MKPVMTWARASSNPVQTTGAANQSGIFSLCTATRDRPTNSGRYTAKYADSANQPRYTAGWGSRSQ